VAPSSDRFKYVVTVGGKEYEVEIEELGEGKFKAIVNGKEVIVRVGGAAPAAPEAAPTPKAEVPKPSAPPAAPAVQAVKPAPAPKAPAAPAAPTPVAPPAPAPAGGKAVTAQLPGKVLKVLVKPGDRVKKGDVLLTIESMKMEIEIYAESDGVVKEVRVKPGDPVNTGDVLVILS